MRNIFTVIIVVTLYVASISEAVATELENAGGLPNGVEAMKLANLSGFKGFDPAHIILDFTRLERQLKREIAMMGRNKAAWRARRQQQERARADVTLPFYDFIYPLRAKRSWISSGFGMRRHPVTGRKAMHKGTDFAADLGTPVLSVAGGIVTKTGYNKYLGKYIKVKHYNNSEAIYGHLHVIDVKPRQKLHQGQKIARLGNTGRSTGPHLHLTIKMGGRAVDPVPLIDPGSIDHKFVGKWGKQKLPKISGTPKKAVSLISKLYR